MYIFFKYSNKNGNIFAVGTFIIYSLIKIKLTLTTIIVKVNSGV